ncbi:uncharacterized protein G2W53_022233 [Senna tora]|uniref:Uncharacterized protein n=1 Tax=Senna tora TaxID=362788 RepID=A0A834WP02_9FABA|nr:uncharacterized protein G2W53_022233 [Senna tora]
MVAASCKTCNSIMHITAECPSLVRKVSAVYQQNQEQPQDAGCTMDSEERQNQERELLVNPEQKVEETPVPKVDAIALKSGKKVGGTKDDNDEEGEVDETIVCDIPPNQGT